MINPTKDQERRFFGFCRRTIADRKILMREQALGPHSALVIGKILAHAPGYFSHLDVSRNNLGNGGLATLLARGVRLSCSLVHLDIGSNDITCEGAQNLFQSIEGHPSLASLVIANHDRLHRNRLSERSCQALGTLLERNQVLTMLNIADNSISNEGLRLISQGFARAPSKELVSLNLSHNDLEGVPAVESLAAFLESSSALQLLNLNENRIGNEGIELLAKAFNEGKSRLSKLYLANVGGTAAGFKTLFMALKSNQHLVFLNLDGNDFKSPPRYSRENLLKMQNYYNYEGYTNPNLDQLSIFLWNNKRLETLELRHCQLDD